VMSVEAHTIVLGALEEWNLPRCGRVTELVPDKIYKRWLLSVGLGESLTRLAAGTQFALEVPEDALGVRLTVYDFEAPDGMGYALLGRVGEPVLHDWSTIDVFGLGLATPETYDWKIGRLSEPEEIELFPGGDPPLVLGETLYLALASENLGELEQLALSYGQIELGVEMVRPASAPHAESPQGCACGSTPAPSGVWLVLAGLWLRRRSSWS
jgi:MYXO-CTERM domain-containing protein